MKNRYFCICGLLIFVALAVTALAYKQLPEAVPLHWGFQAHIDGYGPRWAMFILGPGLMAAAVGLFAMLPKISPKHFDMATFQATYRYLMLVIVAMMGCLYVITLWAAWSDSANLPSATLAATAVFFVLMGNVMGKVRRNFWIGIRTPWTLADERVWYATHRLAGKTIVLAALACLGGVLVALPSWVCLALLLVGPVLPAVYSLVYYKRLDAAGGLV